MFHIEKPCYWRIVSVAGSLKGGKFDVRGG